MVDRLARMSRPCVATHGCGDSRGTDAWFHPHAPARGLSIASQPALDGMLNERSWVPGLGWVAAGAYRTVVAMLVARASPLLNTLIGSKCVKPTHAPPSQHSAGCGSHGSARRASQYTHRYRCRSSSHPRALCVHRRRDANPRSKGVTPLVVLMFLAVRQGTSRYEAACRIQEITRAAPNPPLSVGERCDPAGCPDPRDGQEGSLG